MKELIFATQNEHKLTEASHIIGNSFRIIKPEDRGLTGEIPETSDTLEGNASQKAWYIYNHCLTNCFADDTGLEVEALGGRPGVFSARYAGEEKSFEKNIEKILRELQGVENRKARFRTVVALIMDGREYLFEGIVNGTIIPERRGIMGFGYDSVFQPDGYSFTFAEMDLDEKNRISHRGEAMRKLSAFLAWY